MKWPVPQDFNEAVQTPGLAFSDPDLKAGQAVVGAQGLPLPRSGNFADVYQIRAADGRDWAVKCFTRPVVGMDQRYRKIGDHLREANLPFSVGFGFLPEGIRVRGQWFPAVKMEWVEGLLLNQFVRENASKPHVLDALFQMWVRLSRRLREANMAHADLQHGNVLLVPGSKTGSLGLKLIDYDGMFIPALANQPAGELGHANFQHPDRAAKQIFSQDLDRFPHLVIGTALKGLARLGPALWERYDTGENLLFNESDFLDPAHSRLMQELLKTDDPAVMAMVGRLALACKRPLPQTPWLDTIAPKGIVEPLSATESRDAMKAFDIGVVPTVPPAAVKPGMRSPIGTRQTSNGTRSASLAPVDLQNVDDWVSASAAPVRTLPANAPALSLDDTEFQFQLPRKAKPRHLYAIAAGMLFLVVLGCGIIYYAMRPNSFASVPSPRSDENNGTPSTNINPALEKPAPPPSEPIKTPEPPIVKIEPPEPGPPEIAGTVAIAPPPRLAPTPVEPVVPVPPLQPARFPVPDNEALAKAEESVHAILKDEYARKLPAEKKAFAQKLIALAGQTNDNPAGRFVMLKDACDLAIEANEPALAMQAVDALLPLYDLDAAAHRLQTLDKMLLAMSAPMAIRGVAEQALLAADATGEQDDFESALKMAKLAADAARKAAFTPGVEESDSKSAQLKRVRDAFAVVKGSQELLKTIPDHPEANLAVGKYHGFLRGQWEGGLKHLALGSDKAIKLAAEAELEAGPGKPDFVKAADAWWDYAMIAPETEKRAVESRARHWYQKALAGLSGLSKTRAESRMSFTMSGVEYAPGLLADFTGGPVSLFKGKKGFLDNKEIDFRSADLALSAAPKANFTVRWTGLLIPPKPGSYKLIARTNDPIRIKIDNRAAIDTIANKANKKDAVVRFLDRPLNVQIELSISNNSNHTLQLLWLPAGGTQEELIPRQFWFHDKKLESILGK